MLLMGLQLCAQEDVKLSTYTKQHILYSPSMSIAHSGINVTGLYRQQWNISGSPTGGFISASSGINGSGTFVSGYVSHERISIYDKTISEIGISQKLSLGKGNFVGAGLAGGFNSVNVDLSRAQFTAGDQIIANNLASDNLVMATASATYLNTAYKLNVSIGIRDALHFRNLIGYISKNFDLSPSVELDISSLSKYSLRTNKYEVDLTGMVTYNDFISVGISGRNTKQFVALLNIDVMKKFDIGYAYDFHYGDLAGLSAHEIYLRFKLSKSQSVSKIGFTNPRI